ncbi:DNA recombination protein RmuC [Candidatus Marinarcus aquaticus]|uniref:DNA recombination protein RmuC n=1 Tax=Candidatus Marinarcus aquaticus TaxID=2044504 RepID=A0A4Q0XRP3_9BACT|nr:DNA recombination protein RmuC [Candidatus Marinarcus aquaticus]RXJ60177.1 DNA recombination protein RmuC [Candidatus Marinarcus aquaticus]
MIETAIFCGGLLVGAVVVYLVLKQRHQLIVSNLENEANLKLESLNDKLQNEQAHFNEKSRLIEESKESMQSEFENLVNKLFHENTQKSNQNLNLMLKPLKEQLNSFTTRVNEVYNEETKQRSSLLTEIKNLKELNQKISQDAINLTKALKGENKTQGDWGEMILESILEQSGLRKDKEYTIQNSYTDDNNKRLRPDVILHLPENKDIIIDSKVSLNAYVQHVNAETKQEQEEAKKELERSFMAHIKGLSAKRYEDIKELRSLDFVLMFVPIEGAFLLAASQNGNLFKTAFDNNIMIVSPSTLFVTLRTIENIWKFEYQNENAQKIAEKAGNLYDKFVLFLESFQTVGKSIEKAQEAYDTSMNRLSSGKGNVVSKVEEFKQMGVKPNKQIGQNLLEE